MNKTSRNTPTEAHVLEAAAHVLLHRALRVRRICAHPPPMVFTYCEAIATVTFSCEACAPRGLRIMEIPNALTRKREWDAEWDRRQRGGGLLNRFGRFNKEKF